MEDKQIVFIPWWIHTVLVRNGLKTEDLLSFERIRSFFSVEDLASLVAMNSHSVFRFFVSNGIESDITQIGYRWLSVSPKDSDAALNRTVADIIDLGMSEQFKEDTLNRLVTEPTPHLQSNAVIGTVPKDTFEVSFMGEKGIAVVIKQGFSLLEHRENFNKLFRCMVKKLYVYEDGPKLMSRRIGLAYVESLLQ